MPEVVAPTRDEEGNPRTWDQVFPIWSNDDEDTEWRVIDQILESIAMNNRFGDKTPEELRDYLIFEQHKFYHDKLAGLLQTEQLEERAKTFEYYGKWMYYLTEVFANFGGAWREYKS